MSEDILHALRVALALGLATDLTVNKMAEEIVDTIGIPASTLASLRAALGEARMHIAEERKSLVECDTIPDANEWRDESTMNDLTKEAVAEIDALFAKIDAVLAAQEGRDGE